MFIGKPILLCAAGEAATILKTGQFGVSAKPGDPQALSDAAVTLSKMTEEELLFMGDKAKTFYRDNMSMENGVHKTALAIKSIN